MQNGPVEIKPACTKILREGPGGTGKDRGGPGGSGRDREGPGRGPVGTGKDREGPGDLKMGVALKFREGSTVHDIKYYL